MSRLIGRGALIGSICGWGGLPAGGWCGMLAGVGVLVPASPLVCWGLAARTARTGWVVAAMLAFCGAAEVAAAKGWVLPGSGSPW